MTTKKEKTISPQKPKKTGGKPEKKPKVKGMPAVDDELRVDANVGIDGECIQPGGAEDDRPDTGEACRSSMEIG